MLRVLTRNNEIKLRSLPVTSPNGTRLFSKAYINRKEEHEIPSLESVISKFDFPLRTHTIKSLSHELIASKTGPKLITLHGWIANKPRKVSSKLVFANFRDCLGDEIQLIASKLLSDAPEEGSSSSLVAKLKNCHIEDCLAITGELIPKKTNESLANEQSPNIDDYDFQIKEIQRLNLANMIPAQLSRTDTFDYPPEHRYLQLRQPEFQKILKYRSKAIHQIRQTLVEEEDFTEVETPILFKSTPEGAREFLVPTRKENNFYALPQSPQQYKQLLMASGVNKYFQIAKCFRDEDLRADRQPEFTQVDMEMAFAKSEDVMRVVEKLVSNIWKAIKDLKIYVPVGDDELMEFESGDIKTFPELNYIDCLTNYGIDKPDLRSKLRFINISDFIDHEKLVERDEDFKDFPVFEVCVLKKEKNITDLDVNKLNNEILYKARIPKVIKIDEANIDSWYNELLFNDCEEFLNDIAGLQRLLSDVKVGDVIACSNRAEFPYENPTPLGRFRQIAIAEYPTYWRRDIVDVDGNIVTNVKNEDIFVGSWVTNFPLFSPSEQEETSQQLYPLYDFNKLVATHHPFTMFKLEDYDKLQDKSKRLDIKGDHYDLVINGVEVGGGSRRVHDVGIQRYIFKEILQIENPEFLFGHLLKAFDTGCPPHAGLAIGFDRMMAMLLGLNSIRNVIAFPKNQSGTDMVVNSPSKVDEKRLKEYHVKVV